MLVAGEFTLAVALLAGAGLAIHSFLNLQRVDLGVRTDHVLDFYLAIPDSRSKERERIVAYYHQILASMQSDRLREMRGMRQPAIGAQAWIAKRTCSRAC
ncbi:MAG TPA: hypothetical protein VGM27_20180 [Acidobacteriaceae bacterium]